MARQKIAEVSPYPLSRLGTPTKKKLACAESRRPHPRPSLGDRFRAHARDSHRSPWRHRVRLSPRCESPPASRMLRAQLGKHLLGRFPDCSSALDLLSAPDEFRVPRSLRIPIRTLIQGLNEKMSQFRAFDFAEARKLCPYLFCCHAHAKNLRLPLVRVKTTFLGCRGIGTAIRRCIKALSVRHSVRAAPAFPAPRGPPLSRPRARSPGLGGFRGRASDASGYRARFDRRWKSVRRSCAQGGIRRWPIGL